MGQIIFSALGDVLSQRVRSGASTWHLNVHPTMLMGFNRHADTPYVWYGMAVSGVTDGQWAVCNTEPTPCTHWDTLRMSPVSAHLYPSDVPLGWETCIVWAFGHPFGSAVHARCAHGDTLPPVFPGETRSK